MREAPIAAGHKHHAMMASSMWRKAKVSTASAEAWLEHIDRGGSTGFHARKHVRLGGMMVHPALHAWHASM